MTPSDLNRIEGAFAEAAIAFGARHRALTVAETFRNPARLTSSDALLGDARRLARDSTPLDRGPRRRRHVNSQDQRNKIMNA
jgi:hypothetical protein